MSRFLLMLFKSGVPTPLPLPKTPFYWKVIKRNGGYFGLSESPFVYTFRAEG